MLERQQGKRKATLRNRLGSTRGFESLVGGNEVSFLRDGEMAFPAMLADIEAASHEILLEMYWFGSDRIGWRFADLLRRRSEEGLDVRIIYDAVGSIEADEALFDALRASGCEVWQYNPIAPWRQRFRLGVVNRRDHRKMLIVDGQIGYTGGVNIGDEWLPESQGGVGFRDDMVRIDGPAVADMRGIFMHTWRALTGAEDPPEARPPPATEVELPTEEARVRVLANEYLGERRAIRREYLSRIGRAQRSVYLTNSYFCPDPAIRRALCDAVARGVDVRVLVPGRSDVIAVYYAGRRMYERLLRHGVRIYEWHSTILHAKTATIDGVWCTVGTYNLDYRSLRFNLEVTAVIEDPSVAGRLEERFLSDLEGARPVELRHFRYRPPLERLIEHFFYMFRKLL